MIHLCKIEVRFIYQDLYIPGQGSVLHSSTLVSFPSQSFPPLYATTLIVLVEVLFPPSHDFEHLDQGYHGDHEQSVAVSAITFSANK